MLEALLSRLPDVQYLETTVTPDNEPSMKLFSRLGELKKAAVGKTVLFEKNAHFDGEHEDEILLRVGPLNSLTNATTDAEPSNEEG